MHGSALKREALLRDGGGREVERSGDSLAEVALLAGELLNRRVDQGDGMRGDSHVSSPNNTIVGARWCGVGGWW